MGQRLVKVTVHAQSCFLVIRVENYYEDVVKFDGELPETTKTDPVLHGFGLKSIRRTLEKYGGHISFDNRQNWFAVLMLVPLPQE